MDWKLFSKTQGPSDEELQRRADNLHSAAEKASRHVRNLEITLWSLGAYLAIVFGSTTHEQLLRGGPVKLPLLNVELHLVIFYWVAPFLFVLLHFNLLVQAHYLADKLKRLHDEAFNRPWRKSTEDRIERARLDFSPLTQMLAGDIQGYFVRTLTWIMTWMTFAWLPMALLIIAQISFLPYHDRVTTWWHRILLLADLVLLWIIWMTAGDLSNAERRPSRTTFWPFKWPFEKDVKVDAHVKGHWANLALVTPLAIGLSFVLFTIPGELLDGLIGETKLKFAPRNLVVRETNLVGGWPTQEQIEQYGEYLAWQNFGKPPSLRERDLRYADLSHSIFVRADLRGVNLEGAALQYANLQDVDLDNADLQEANLLGVNLQGAIGSSNLQGAHLGAADLQGAEFGFADLRGANLLQSNLRGAVLANAKLQGAYLRDADLRGADLRGANLQGASLFNANLQGASLFNANLQGADLANSNLQGTDLRLARLWQARLGAEPDHYRLADVRGVDFDPPGADEIAHSLAEAKDIANQRGRQGVLAVLNVLGEYEGQGQKTARWQLEFLADLAERTDVLLDRVAAPPFADFDPILAEFLIKLACECRAPPGVARTVALRATFEHEEGRLYPGLVAGALLGDACAPAAKLDQQVLQSLRERLQATSSTETRPFTAPVRRGVEPDALR